MHLRQFQGISGIEMLCTAMRPTNQGAFAAASNLSTGTVCKNSLYFVCRHPLGLTLTIHSHPQTLLALGNIYDNWRCHPEPQRAAGTVFGCSSERPNIPTIFQASCRQVSTNSS